MQFTANCQSAKRTRKHSATTQTVYLEISGLVGFSTFFYVYSLCWSVRETQAHLQHACALSVWTSANIQVQGLLLACHRSLPGACPLLQVPVNSKASPGSSADWVCLYHGRWNRSFALSACAESLSSVFEFAVVLSLYTNRSESTHSAQRCCSRVVAVVATVELKLAYLGRTCRLHALFHSNSRLLASFAKCFRLPRHLMTC